MFLYSIVSNILEVLMLYNDGSIINIVFRGKFMFLFNDNGVYVIIILKIEL